MPPVSPPFPIVGVATPLVMGMALWAMLGSPFALVGAVLGPAMVVAHYADARRRARRDERRAAQRESVQNASRDADRWAELVAECAAENAEHPSILHISRTAQWSPPMDRRADVRAGSQSRGGLGGFPWRVNIADGVAVVGDGPAADAVWFSLVTHGCSAHGPLDPDAQHLAWPSGAWIHRGVHESAGVTIRCRGPHIDTVTRRGRLPEPGDWQIDDTTGWREIFLRLDTDQPALPWTDRGRCDTGIGLANDKPLVIDPTSDSPHLLICGRTGTGKSEFLAALICDWAERFTPEQLSWVGFDFKGGAALTPLEHFPQCRGIVTDLDDALVPRAVHALAAELVDRERQLRVEGVSRIEDSLVCGRLVVVIDEFPELVRRHPDAVGVLADIARRGRSLGVHLVLSTQLVGAVSRDGLAANIAVRVCFPLSTEHDVTSALGVRARVPPAVGRPVIVGADGTQSRVVIRHGARPANTVARSGDRLSCLWREPLRPPITGCVGFGITDDVLKRAHNPAVWNTGDVVVVGQRGSGRTTALRALVRDCPTTLVTTFGELEQAKGFVVIDDLDRLYDEIPDSRKHELATLLAMRRREPHAPTFLMSVSGWVPRLHGLVPNVLVLGLPTRDAHLATGEPAETFDPSAEPGVGSWRGRRVVVYARTESIVTESMP